MIALTRTFHPVGQGAFYSEEFADADGNVVFRVVYDCGCIQGAENQSHGIRILDGVIANWEKGGHPGIDYLFISHFDFDHVSLLRTLRDKRVNVKKVISPFLEYAEKMALLNFYSGVVRESSVLGFLTLLIENPGETLRAANIRIRSKNDGDHLQLEKLQENVNSVASVPSGTMFPVVLPGEMGRLDWCYIPCNYDDCHRGEQFRKTCAAKFGAKFKPTTLENFPRLMKLYGRGKRGAFRKLKAVYDSVDGNINENSMIVYSGPEDCEREDRKCFVQSILSCDSSKCSPQYKLPCVAYGNAENCIRGICRPACIYTGDADLKAAKIDRWYSDFWRFVGTIQVPHHGSRLSFSHAQFSGGCYQCPISCSDKCYYKHPHTCVTNALAAKGCIPVRVTESFEFRQEFEMQL